MFKLPKEEEERIKNILKRAFDKESGLLKEKDVRLTEDNPDGRKRYSFSLYDTKSFSDRMKAFLFVISIYLTPIYVIYPNLPPV